MFSFATVLTAMQLNNRLNKQSNLGLLIAPAPIGLGWPEYSVVLTVIPNLMFVLNNWLADGLLVSSLFDAAFTRPNV
jgi:hypothetical protein